MLSFFALLSFYALLALYIFLSFCILLVFYALLSFCASSQHSPMGSEAKPRVLNDSPMHCQTPRCPSPQARQGDRLRWMRLIFCSRFMLFLFFRIFSFHKNILGISDEYSLLGN